MGFRTLRPGQVTCVWTVDVESNATELVLRDDEILLEAPNWVASGLLLNGAGTLWDLDLDGQLTPIEIPDLPALNNDHVPAPDGRHVYVSADDGHIYRAPLAGGSASRDAREQCRQRLEVLLLVHSPSLVRLRETAQARGSCPQPKPSASMSTWLRIGSPRR